MSTTADIELTEWLALLPAVAAALGDDRAANRVLLEDVRADEGLLSRAAAGHPVLRARAHLAQGAIHLALAEAAGDETLARRGLEHCDAAAELGGSLAASGPRLAILTQAGATAATGLALVRHSDRRTVGRLLRRVSEEAAQALLDQGEQEARGTATLAAALALADAVGAVAAGSRAEVLARAREMAVDAQRDLARAGAVARARAAADAVAEMEAELSRLR